MNNCKILWQKCSYLKKKVPQEDIVEGFEWTPEAYEQGYTWVACITVRQLCGKLVATINIGHRSTTQDSLRHEYPKLRDARGRMRRDWQNPMRIHVKQLQSSFRGEVGIRDTHLSFSEERIKKLNTSHHEVLDIFLYAVQVFRQCFPIVG